MDNETAAICVLSAYAVIAVGTVLWQMFRCPSGPMVWWLYVAERLGCGLLWRVRGLAPNGRTRRCPFPQESAALIVANHRSGLDPVVLWHGHHLSGPERRIRPISFLMAKEFYDDRRLTWFYKAMWAIPVSRDGHDMGPVRKAISRLKAGDLVGIFPEGGINHGPPGVKSANSGVAFLALATDAPVYPVFIAGSADSGSVLKSLLQFARIRLIYGEPIDLSAFRDRKKSQDVLREVTDLIMSTVASLGGVTYAGTVTAEPPAKETRRAGRDPETKKAGTDGEAAPEKSGANQSGADQSGSAAMPRRSAELSRNET